MNVVRKVRRTVENDADPVLMELIDRYMRSWGPYLAVGAKYHGLISPEP
jgi:hypothetical protein